jgi:hypothetical protein
MEADAPPSLVEASETRHQIPEEGHPYNPTSKPLAG